MGLRGQRRPLDAVGLVFRYEDMRVQRSGLSKDEIANLSCRQPGCKKKLGFGRPDRLYCSETCRWKHREMERVRFNRSELREKLCPECREVLLAEVRSR